jgi:uncharacterized membrane protein YdbT with pleckstrin-like domain
VTVFNVLRESMRIQKAFKREEIVSFIDKSLLGDEKVIHRTKRHWIVFFWPAVLLVLAVYGFSKGGGGAVWGVLLVFTSIITSIICWLERWTAEFGVTNKRVLVKVGLIRRNSLEILLPKVEGVHVQQSILGRMLGYGTIIVNGTGGSKQPFHKIDGPMEFRKQVHEQMNPA